MKNAVFLSQKSWWKYDIHKLLKSSCFNLLRDGKHGLFLSQKVDVKMIFTGYWNVLVLIFSGMRNTVFFWAKSWWKADIYWLLEHSCFELFDDGKIRSLFESRSWWKDDIYCLLRSSCFERFGDWKYGLFFIQKFDGQIIFTWSFLTFHDILGLGKYGFSCSVRTIW